MPRQSFQTSPWENQISEIPQPVLEPQPEVEPTQTNSMTRQNPRNSHLPLLVLKVLKEKTDSRCDPPQTMSVQQITQCLAKEYEFKASRRGVADALNKLIEWGFPVGYEVKGVRYGGEQEIHSNYCYQHPFTDGELHFLINSALFSQTMSKEQCGDLVGRLKALAGPNFQTRLPTRRNSLEENLPGKTDVTEAGETLLRAISQHKKVKFHYADCGMDKKIHPRADLMGHTIEYVVSPYKIVLSEDKPTLLGAFEGHCVPPERECAPFPTHGGDIQNVAGKGVSLEISSIAFQIEDVGTMDLSPTVDFCRIDRVLDLEILREKAVSLEELPEAEQADVDIARYLAGHPYLHAGQMVNATLRVDRKLLFNVLDTFGTDNTRLEETGYPNDQFCLAHIRATEVAVAMFCSRNGPFVMVESPKKLEDTPRATWGDYRLWVSPEGFKGLPHFFGTEPIQVLYKTANGGWVVQLHHVLTQVVTNYALSYMGEAAVILPKEERKRMSALLRNALRKYEIFRQLSTDPD